MAKRIFLTDTQGAYELATPKGLYPRGPFWWARPMRVSTDIRVDGGTRAQSKLNAKAAEQKRKELLGARDGGATAPKARHGGVTINAVIKASLDSIPRPSRQYDDERDRLAHWSDTIGTLDAGSIRPSQIRAAMVTLHQKGLAFSTVNRCLTSLQACFRRHLADDETASNPVERVERFTVAKRVPGGRAIGYDVIDRILAAMPDLGQSAPPQARTLALVAINGRRPRKAAIKRSTVNLTKVRLALMAATGLPPQLISEIEPKADIRWQFTPPQLRVRPRKKGGGTDERWIPLSPAGAQALRAFVEAGAMGSFSRHSAYKSFQAAARRVIQEQLDNHEEPCLRYRVRKQKRTRRKVTTIRTVIVPLGPSGKILRPYDLRHSFITDALIRSKGNAVGVQQLAIHGTVEQTLQYAEGAKHAQALEVVEALSATAQVAPFTGKKGTKTGTARKTR